VSIGLGKMHNFRHSPNTHRKDWRKSYKTLSELAVSKVIILGTKYQSGSAMLCQPAQPYFSQWNFSSNICFKKSPLLWNPLVPCYYNNQIIRWCSYIMFIYWHKDFISSKLITSSFQWHRIHVSYFSLHSPTKIWLLYLLYNLHQGCTNSGFMVTQET
jgi:hypothetical protein